MAVINPDGGMKIWDVGEPFAGIKRSNLSASDLTFWFNGKPWADFVPSFNAQAKFFSLIY